MHAVRGDDSLRGIVALLAASIVVHFVVLLTLPSNSMARVVAKPMQMFLEVAAPPARVESPPPAPQPKRAVMKMPARTPAAASRPSTASAPPSVGMSADLASDVGEAPVLIGSTPFGPAARVVTKKPTGGDGEGFAPPGGADVEPTLLGEIKVPYPAEALRHDASGTVRMMVTLNANGVVTSVKVLSGPGYGLNEAARDAMLRFRFKHAMKSGEAVGYTFTYAYTFELE